VHAGRLSPAQVARFLAACSPRWQQFFTVALDTGLRRGEMIGLRREDVALLERVLYVRHSIGAYDDPDEAEDDANHLTTKTEAWERIVPLLDGARAALEEVLAESKDMRDEAPIFATVERKRGRDGVIWPVGRPLSPRMVTRVSVVTRTEPDYRRRFARTTSGTRRSRAQSARGRTS
jgi:integrase